MDVGSILRATAARLPDKKAVIFGNKSFTFSELDQGADRVANFIPPWHQKVAWQSSFLIPRFVVYFGIIPSGAIRCP
jgi:acyl-CoA synthetase (AMP-forming)/AMP-acid ligase II